ncbi:MAG: exodeoxyribonuclease VII small subunit [Pirellulaceae bacterium]|jgi:exodeoxyribonuclease VII small subunit|nr:exodeoxyribonuclease VII small subunit [Pirellulaceae bacterium]
MAKKTDSPGAEPPDADALTFEQALEQLEAIVARLEGGQLGLSEALAQYERGIHVLQRCYRQLEQAEQKIELLSGTDAAGRAQTEPFAEAEMSLEEKQAARGRRRSRPGTSASPDAEIDDRGSLF